MLKLPCVKPFVMGRHRFCFILTVGILAFCASSAADETTDDSRARRRRSLRYLGSFDDPKSVESKQTFNILALGGSITWGAELQERHDEAYPMVIGDLYNKYLGGTLDVSVDNLAIRATGADYPRMCLQSLVSDANPNEPNKSYDLILLDFILNGVEGFTALMHRLRQRYSDAEIIMVELWSLKGSIEEVGTKLTVRDVGPDNDREWIWAEHSNRFKEKKSLKIQEMERMVERFNARHIALPCPPTPRQVIDEKWFSRDWHHPSAFGHRVIAKTIFDVLIERSDVPLMKGKRVGDWGLGDQCYNWFLSGNVPLSYEGAKLNSVATSDGMAKSFLEIDDNGGSIEFFSRFDIPVMISLGYMSRQEPAEYPKVRMYVESDKVGENLNEEQKVLKINPNKNRLVDPTAHIGTYSPIAYASPGRNIIKIFPMEHTPQQFRVVGIYLCAACTPYDVAMAQVDEAS